MSSTSPSRARGAFSWVALALAIILLPLAVIAFWGQRSLTDTQSFVNTMSPLATQSEIREVVSQKTADALISKLSDSDIKKTYLSDLPPAAQDKLLAPIRGGVEALITQAVNRVMASPEFSSAWDAATAAAQKSLIDVLSGKGSGPVEVQGDEVVLDVSQLATTVQQRLVDRGITVLAGKPLPPAADTQIVLLKSKQLAQARTIYSLTVPLAKYLILFVALLLVLAVWLARRRSSMLMWAGLLGVLVMLALRLGLIASEGIVTNQFAGTGLESAVDAFYLTLTRYLMQSTMAMVALGASVAVAAWFGGRSRAATRARSATGSALASAGSGAEALAGVGGFVGARHGILRVAVPGLIILTLLLHNPLSASAVLWTALWALLGLALVEFLAGAGEAREAQQV